MSNPLDDLQTQLWVLAALGRLARQGLLDRAAPPEDPLAVASQRLLIEAGWLEANPVGSSSRLRSAVPPGLPLDAPAFYVSDLLTLVRRYAEGTCEGWSQQDPDIIRWYGRVSGVAVPAAFTRAFAELDDFPERLTEPGAAFLDVGVGAAGISITLCRTYPQLRAVGLDISPAAIAVARDETKAAGLADRIEIRHQSVTDVDDLDAFDLIWVPQPFLSSPVLLAALPRLRRAARPGAAVVMGLATNDDHGLPGASADLHHLMLGGGTMSIETAGQLLTNAGFADAKALQVDGNTAMVAIRPAQP